MVNEVKVKIIKKNRNELLKRNEITFSVDHTGSGSTSRIETREKLANILDSNKECVFIKKFETKTGSMIMIGEANVYDLVEEAKKIEPEHIILRNTPKNASKE
jgi:small subunit ribosomal protein S24e